MHESLDGSRMPRLSGHAAFTSFIYRLLRQIADEGGGGGVGHAHFHQVAYAVVAAREHGSLVLRRASDKPVGAAL